jgi:hypothetical protein
VGSVGFANAWLALASLAVCAGWVMVATGIFGRWLGWWAIISGIGLALRSQRKDLVVNSAWPSCGWLAARQIAWANWLLPKGWVPVALTR